MNEPGPCAITNEIKTFAKFLSSDSVGQRLLSRIQKLVVSIWTQRIVVSRPGEPDCVDGVDVEDLSLHVRVAIDRDLFHLRLSQRGRDHHSEQSSLDCVVGHCNVVFSCFVSFLL